MITVVGEREMVDVVRCKECKYFGKYVRINRKGDHYYVCNKHGIYMTKESYCSEGIRNDNNQKAE